MPESELEPAAQWAQILFVVAIAAVVLWLLYRGGVLRRDGFAQAPPREGRMSLADLFLGLGLWLLAPVVAGIGLRLWYGLEAGEELPLEGTRGLLVQMAVAEAAMLPAVALILVRAHQVMDGGAGAFGLSLRSPGRTARGLLLGFLAVMPVTLAVAAVARFIVVSLGGEPSTIAHDMLQAFLDAGWGPVRWGILFSAVIVAPLIEEIVFRGLVQTSLRQSGVVQNRWWVIVIAAALFTLPHASMTGLAQWPVMLPTIFTLGVGLGVAYEWTGSLWAPIGIHALFNGSQVAQVLALREAGVL